MSHDSPVLLRLSLDDLDYLLKVIQLSLQADDGSNFLSIGLSQFADKVNDRFLVRFCLFTYFIYLVNQC